MNFSIFKNDFYEDAPGVPWAYSLYAYFLNNGTWNSALMTKSVKEAQLPEIEIRTREVYFGGKDWRIPVRYNTTGQFSLKFYDDKNLTIYKKILQLFRKSYDNRYDDETGRWKYSDARDSIVFQLDILDQTSMKGKDTSTSYNKFGAKDISSQEPIVVASYYFDDVRVNNIEDLDLDYSSEDIVEWGLTLLYNGMRIHYPDQAELDISIGDTEMIDVKVGKPKENKIENVIGWISGNGKGNGSGLGNVEGGGSEGSKNGVAGEGGQGGYGGDKSESANPAKKQSDGTGVPSGEKKDGVDDPSNKPVQKEDQESSKPDEKEDQETKKQKGEEKQKEDTPEASKDGKPMDEKVDPVKQENLDEKRETAPEASKTEEEGQGGGVGDGDGPGTYWEVNDYDKYDAARSKYVELVEKMREEEEKIEKASRSTGGYMSEGMISKSSEELKRLILNKDNLSNEEKQALYEVLYENGIGYTYVDESQIMSIE